MPCSIDNANSPEDIVKLWEQLFHSIFNCLDKVKFDGKCDNDISYDKVKVSNPEIIDAIKSLSLNKSCGMDSI